MTKIVSISNKNAWFLADKFSKISNGEVMKISKIGRILKLKKSELKKSNFKENIPDEKSKLYIKYIISRFLKLPNKSYFKPSSFFLNSMQLE